MRILFVVPYTPNLIRVRPHNLIRALRARGHELTIASLFADERERQQIESWQDEGYPVISAPLSRWRSLWNCLRALPGDEPLQAAYCWQPDLARRAAAQLAYPGDRPAFDVVHVEHLRGVRYGLHLLARAAPVVWDSVDCISLLFRQASVASRSRISRWWTRLDLKRTERYEGWLAQQFDHVLVTSAIDRQALLDLVPAGAQAADVSVVTNGVDLTYFRPDPGIRREPATLVFSGKMSYHANVTMALYLVERVMPLVWAERPDARLVIVGQDPPPALRALGQHPSITVTGSVPDIRPYLQTATMAVAPVRYGVGIQNKVLEAMACGTPVVATGRAATALEAVAERDLLLADDPAGLTRAILGLLTDTARRRALGVNGRRYVESTHNWSTIAGHLERIYRGVICQSQALPV